MIKFKYNQDNIEILSKDRELITNESHVTNDFYGQAHIIKKYSNYNKSLKIVYEHSLPYHEIIWDLDINNNLPVAFVSSEFRKNVYLNQRINKKIVNVGSILNYVIELENASNENIEKIGSVYFPPHSTHHIKAITEDSVIINELKQMEVKYYPIYICMYWKDILHGKHEEYIQNGFKVITAGHIYDEMFYFRLYDILRRFKYTIGSSMGSFLFHAVRSGSIVFFPLSLRQSEVYTISTEEFKDKDLDSRIKFSEGFNDRIYKMFENPLENYSQAQLDFVEKYSGSEMKSKKEMKVILKQARILYYYKNINVLIYKKLKSVIGKIFNFKMG